MPLDGSGSAYSRGKDDWFARESMYRLPFEQEVTPEDLLEGGKTYRKEVTPVSFPKT
ncbi:MAG TPA: hypothetical protein VLY86_03030 [Methanothrix sp.]|nr:hypothetical protein [Methanothrix sp.]